MLGSSRGPLQADRGPEQVQQRTYAFLPIADISQRGREFPFWATRSCRYYCAWRDEQGRLADFPGNFDPG